MNFTEALKSTLDDAPSITENGAVGYKTTGKALLDLNFAVSSLRKASETDIENRFMKAFFEDRMAAMKWLFFARDIRGGMGERRLFRIIMKHMAEQYPEHIKPLICLVAEYGRYDDLWCLLDTDLKDEIIRYISDTLYEDIAGMRQQLPVSLLAKWLPSLNASSAATKRYAQIIRKELGLTERNYRKNISDLRSYIDVVERKMSAKKWSKIKYETVPSRANLIYNKAFLRNDKNRRLTYLDSVKKGEAKINAGTLFPHDIVARYCNGGYASVENDTLEELWKALPDTVKECGNTIVVADGSGSMNTPVDRHSKVTALDVANALAIYFAEHMSGEFKDKYITFSMNPQLVDLSHACNLKEKLNIAYRHSEVANTNIEAVFDLILKTAIRNKMTQEDIPRNILILSDMEFDSCASGGSSYDYWAINRPTKTLFDEIEKRFECHGYKMPRLVFWNIASRTGTIPVKQNDIGVALVSGFSPNIATMVMSGELDPYKCLMETLNSDRYQPVEDAIRKEIR